MFVPNAALVPMSKGGGSNKCHSVITLFSHHTYQLFLRKVLLLIGCYIVKCLLPYISFIIVHALQGHLLLFSCMHQVLQGMVYSYHYTSYLVALEPCQQWQIQRICSRSRRIQRLQ